MEGSTPIDEVAEIINTKMPEGDYDTIAGFMSDKLGKVPNKGESVIFKSNKFTILEVTDRRVTKVTISKADIKS